MSWRDSQRFMRIAAIVRGVGWTAAALCLAIGSFAIVETEGDEALFIVRVVAFTIAIVIAAAHIAAHFIEKHAERVVVR